MAKLTGAFGVWVGAAVLVLLLMQPVVVVGQGVDDEVAEETAVEKAPIVPMSLVSPFKMDDSSAFLAPVLIYNFHESVLNVNIYPQLASNDVFLADKQIAAFDKLGMATFNPGTRFVVNGVFHINSGSGSDFMDGASGKLMHSLQEDARELTTGFIAVALKGSLVKDDKHSLRGGMKLPDPLPTQPADDVQSYENKPYHQLAQKMMAVDDVKPDVGTGFFGVVFQAASESLYRIHGYINAGNVAFTWRYFKSERCPRLFVGRGSEWGECAEIAFCSILTLRKGFPNCFEVPQAKLSFTSRK